MATVSDSWWKGRAGWIDKDTYIGTWTVLPQADVDVAIDVNERVRQIMVEDLAKAFDLPAESLGTKTDNQANKKGGNTLDLYEYAVIYVPVNDKGQPDKKNSKVLVGPKTTLATTEQSVKTAALREFTDTDIDLDAVQVRVRPFGGYSRY